MASGSYSNAYGGYTVKTNWSSTKNIEGNYSTVTCTHYLICSSGWDLYIGARTTSCTAGETKSCSISGISTGGGATITLGTTTHTVNHNSDGKKTISASTTFNMQATISSNYVSAITATGTMVLDDIPRASTLTVDNGTLGTTQNLKITRASDSFTHKLEYTCGSASGVIINSTSSVNLAWTPAISLASQNTVGENVTITITLTTYNGSTVVGTSKVIRTYKIPDSVAPTCSVSVSDPTGYATTYGGYIQGVSKFKVTVTGTTSYNSPIASYSTTANGSTYTSSSFTTGVIKSSGTATITGKVTDKRNRSGTKSVTATVLEYTGPKLTKLSVNRCDSDGTENIQGEYIKIEYSCNISSLNSKNTLTSVIKYKKTTDTTYISLTDINASTTSSYTDRSVIIAADSGSSYNIELSITDKFNTNTRTTSVSTAFAFHHYKGPNDEIYSKNIFDYTRTANYCPNSKASQIDNGIRVTLNSDTTTASANYVLFERSAYVGKTIRAKCDITTSSSNMTTAKFSFGYFKSGGTSGIYKEESSSETISLTVDNSSYTEYTHIALILSSNVGQSTSAGEYADFTNIIVTVDDEDMSYEPYYMIPAYEASMGLGKLAEFEGGLDIGFPTKFNKNIFDQFKQLIGNGLAEYESAGIDVNTTLSNLCLTNKNTPNNGYYYVMTMFYSTKSETARRAQIAVPYWYDANNIRRAIYTRYYLDGTWSDWYSASEGVVLYNNSSGTNGTITLSTSAAKFNYLEVFFTDNNGRGGGYVKVYSPNGKTVDLSIIEACESSSTYFRRTAYTISGTSMTPSSTRAGYVSITGSTVAHSSGTNYIKITRVVGLI